MECDIENNREYIYQSWIYTEAGAISESRDGDPIERL
jgi:hypothetical protein